VTGSALDSCVAQENFRNFGERGMPGQQGLPPLPAVFQGIKVMRKMFNAAMLMLLSMAASAQAAATASACSPRRAERLQFRRMFPGKRRMSRHAGAACVVGASAPYNHGVPLAGRGRCPVYSNHWIPAFAGMTYRDSVPPKIGGTALGFPPDWSSAARQLRALRLIQVAPIARCEPQRFEA